MLDKVDRSTQDRVIGLIAEMAAPGAPRPAVTAEAPLSALGLTSFDLVNLMLAVEAEFDITIPQADITPENFRTIAAIERLLARLGR